MIPQHPRCHMSVRVCVCVCVCAQSRLVRPSGKVPFLQPFVFPEEHPDTSQSASLSASSAAVSSHRTPSSSNHKQDLHLCYVDEN